MNVAIDMFFILFMSMVIAWRAFEWQEDDGKNQSVWLNSKLPYETLLTPDLLLIYLIVLPLALFLLDGFSAAFFILKSTFFQIFVQIGLFYSVLVICMPLFHKLASARICAFLWLVPNFLYILTAWYRPRDIDRILKVFVIDFPYMNALGYIWIMGCVIVLSKQVTEHFRFKKQILQHALEVRDGRVYEIFDSLMGELGLKDRRYDIKLVISKEVESPLTIGILKGKTLMVLPHMGYSDEELFYIFRHELIHVSRQDAKTKLFLTVCLAFLWFNPLMWYCFKKCKDDLELSCDETVLLGMEEDKRKKYARLVLSGMCNDKGFSTCLSAKASTMRYRLRCVVAPKKHRFGCILVGLMFFIMFLPVGRFSFAYERQTAKEAMGTYMDGPLQIVSVRNDEKRVTYDDCDLSALFAYLDDLSVYKMSGNADRSASKGSISVWSDVAEDGIELFDHYIIRYADGEENCFYTKEALDLSLMEDLLSDHGTYKSNLIP